MFGTCCCFVNDTATTEIYTLSLHDALPISEAPAARRADQRARPARPPGGAASARRRALPRGGDRKSTRLNSSHANISYAVFCLKKKNQFSYLAERLSLSTQPTDVQVVDQVA